MGSSRLNFFGIFSAAILSACAVASPPRAASSADQVGYAKGVPTDLSNRSHRLEADVGVATQSIEENFPQFLDSLEDCDFQVVLEVYEKSETEGKGQSYLAHRAEAEAVLGFYTAEKKKLVSRVARATSQKAKDKGCDVQLYGSVDWSLQKAVVERLVERRRESSDAHELIEREAEALGKKNLATLEAQADEIMFASYMAHVGAATQEDELHRQVDETSIAQRTLEVRLKEVRADEEPDKEEIKELEEALSAVEPALKTAEAQLQGAEERRLRLEENFEKAWRELRGKLKKRIRATSEEGQATEEQKK